MRVDERWCILRTSGGRTLALARSLMGAGFDAWTPSAIEERKRPRSSIRFERDVPIMPTFVFVRDVHLDDLALLLSRPLNPHPPFSIFQHCRRVPLIGVQSINSLRAEEDRLRLARDERLAAAARRAHLEAQKAARKVKRDLAIGASVTVEGPAFVGVSGIVESSDGRDAWVRFGSQLFKIDAWRVIPDRVTGELEPA